MVERNTWSTIDVVFLSVTTFFENVDTKVLIGLPAVVWVMSLRSDFKVDDDILLNWVVDYEFFAYRIHLLGI